MTNDFVDDKNVKVDEKTWKELAKEKIERNLPRLSDVIRQTLAESKKWQRHQKELRGA